MSDNEILGKARSLFTLGGKGADFDAAEQAVLEGTSTAPIIAILDRWLA